jgi:hypothetical protein
MKAFLLELIAVLAEKLFGILINKPIKEKEEYNEIGPNKTPDGNGPFTGSDW